MHKTKNQESNTVSSLSREQKLNEMPAQRKALPSIGSCSHFCLILQPHRVAVLFPTTFASPWWNSFVQIYGGTTLLKAKSSSFSGVF